MTNEFVYLHGKLGCRDCVNCDPKSLYKSPCCLYRGRPSIHDNGLCAIREGSKRG